MSQHPHLEVQGLTVKFGGLTAINGLSMQVERGRIHALIGPNGAGKSTTFNCISRYYRPTSGRISFDGADITRKKPHEMAALGVARTFQNLELFGALSVRENALLGTYAHGAATVGALLRPAGAEARERVEHLLERVGLADFLDTPACSLDFGRQKMLELARALAISPAATAGRARRRPAQPRDRDAGPPAHRAVRARRHHRAAGRARDAAGHVDLGSHHGDVLRREDRRGHARGGAQQPRVIEAYLGKGAAGG